MSPLPPPPPPPANGSKPSGNKQPGKSAWGRLGAKKPADQGNLPKDGQKPQGRGPLPRWAVWVIAAFAVLLLIGCLGLLIRAHEMSTDLAGLAGVLLAPIYSVHPAMGQEIITPAFVVVVIGGLGSFRGVVVAAILVGLVKGLIVAAGYAQMSTAAIYLLMLLVLLFRPRGLFGERIQRFE